MTNQFVHTIRRNIRSWLIYAGALFIIQVALAAVFRQAGAGLQIRTADLDADGDTDIVVAGKEGTQILFNKD